MKYARKLLLNVLILASEVCLIWLAYRSFTGKTEPLVGAISFIAALVFLWFLIYLSRLRVFRRQRPGMIKTTFLVVILLAILSFAGIQPLEEIKDTGIEYTVSGWKAFGEWLDVNDTESLDKRRAEMYILTNEQRSLHDLPELRRDEYLEILAEAHARSLFERDSVDHAGFPLRSSFLEQRGFYSTGENVAGGTYSASNFVSMWMNSPGHKANLLNRSFTDIGIGVYDKYAVQLFAGR